MAAVNGLSQTSASGGLDLKKLMALLQQEDDGAKKLAQVNQPKGKGPQGGCLYGGGCGGMCQNA